MTNVKTSSLVVGSQAEMHDLEAIFWSAPGNLWQRLKQRVHRSSSGERLVRSRPERNLRKFAKETGGGYFELRRTDDFDPTFTRVAQELHSQYVLGFAPTMCDGKMHHHKVRMSGQGTTARARRSYVAPSDADADGASDRSLHPS